MEKDDTLLLNFFYVLISSKNLLSDEAMILDSGAEIYCWIGQAATEEEGKAALEMATV